MSTIFVRFDFYKSITQISDQIKNISNEGSLFKMKNASLNGIEAALSDDAELSYLILHSEQLYHFFSLTFLAIILKADFPVLKITSETQN